MARNKYLTTTEEYNKRLDICKSCEFYFKPTGTCKKCGCFMRLKAKLSHLSCPISRWRNTSIIEEQGKISPEILQEVKNIWPHIKNKVATDYIEKGKAIQIFNAIYNTHFTEDSNCSSCLDQVYNGLKNIHDKYIKNE
tara:strand:+ start:24190 stop:24603 length:414 start_codon:yes stop_codon:yes gene_type:complete